MGTCDVVPGISGGTIAFITGIYEIFIRSVKNIVTKEFLTMNISLLKGDLKQFRHLFFKLEMDFLMTLLLGILSALFLVSKLVLHLLENYKSHTLMFFVGLILASTIFIKKEIKSHTPFSYLLALTGFTLGISLSFLDTTALTNVNLVYLTLGGFLAISAMFLPGISGSFILLVLGLYDIVYGALHNIIQDYKILISFGIGVAFGAIFISKLIDYLFQIAKSKTLYFLLGLVIGALIVPLKEIYLSTPFFNLSTSITLLFFAALGILIVTFVNLLSKR